ncbi:5,6-dimethylbenzimidazole synthase [Bradyrhizobium lablabi]|uniref:5,6-dimethylbenzimidazole synthase n=1 Tax=Bradyrhizobium lablabi TaxID=722472 RepID=UPI001BAB8A9E|nr:5,6-dimethylbenzimidazole synthase [Bradyrhizobium lablabi]MBR0692859.1 5,6-dimethylbenzimidazole synthase [Bradyrhizobium lablabi]
MNQKPDAPNFDSTFRAGLLELLAWRRDVRRFRSEPLPPGMVERLIEVACLAPSVGLSQPWRFVLVEDVGRREAAIANFESCNADALADYDGGLATRYARLKLAGLREAPCHLAVFADRSTTVGHGLGRRTMPEMADYSVVTAIFSMWLVARAEGVGMGWVSILDPVVIARILDVPKDWRFIGYFCIGYPMDDEDIPELERAGWEHRRSPQEFVFCR